MPEEVTAPSSTDLVIAALQSMTEVSATTSEEIEAGILARYLAATTPEELLRQGTTMPADEVIGWPIVVTGVHWNEAKVKDGAPVYAVIDAKLDDKPVTITCGSRNVMMQLYQANAKGWLPLECVIERLAHETANGYRPMFLTAVLPGHREAYEATKLPVTKTTSRKPPANEKPF